MNNNYTTIEQSKLLVDLGLPKESADMYYQLQYVYEGAYTGFDDCPKGETYYLNEPMLRHTNPAGTYTIENGKRIDLGGVQDKLKKTDIPCWSVGRLQEIAKICAKEKEYYYTSLDIVAHQEDFVEWWVKYFTLTDNVLFDFSKL